MNSKEIFNLIDYINSLESKVEYYKKMYLYVAKLYIKEQIKNNEKLSLIEKNFNFVKASMCN